MEPTIRKLYYTIGEVSQITNVPAHVLRYWETEFPHLKPKKRSGNRVYQDKDIEIVQRIRTLLYEQKYTIAGARAQLTGKTDEESNGHNDLINDVRRGLQEILEIFENNSGRGAAR
jgi:DNA-binding transcriptional MerR regulator